MPDSRMFKIGSTIFLIVDIVLIIFGLLYAIYADLMPYHIDFIGQSTYDTMVSTYPSALTLSRLSILLIGFLFLSVGTCYGFIWYVSFRKGERWAWLLALVSGGLVIIPLLGVIMVVAGTAFPFPVGLASLILWALAITLTAKEALKTT